MIASWIKITVGVVSGFAGGFAAGFLTHRYISCKKDIVVEEVTEEELDRLIKEAAEKSVELTNDTEDKIDILSKKIEADGYDLNPDNLRATLQGKTQYAKATDGVKEKYSEVYDTVKTYSNEENADNIPVEEEGFDEEFLESLELEEVEPGEVEPPHLISLSEYYNDKTHDKETIEWYEGDNTWIDENDEIIADIDSYVGLNARKLFTEKGRADLNEDPDIRFVRYDEIGTDFEIVRHHQGYKELTEGDG